MRCFLVRTGAIAGQPGFLVCVHVIALFVQLQLYIGGHVAFFDGGDWSIGIGAFLAHATLCIRTTAFRFLAARFA